MSDIYVRRIEEHIEPGLPRLGRHVKHDPRSRDYVAETATKVRSVVHNARGLPLDQVRGSCTSEAFCGGLNSDPNFKGGRIYQQPDAERLYDEEIVLEGGNPATDDPGGTGLNICKVGKRDKLIRSYRHAFGIDQALKALVLRPVMFGVDWYRSFDQPNAKGLVKLDTSSGIRGGHEIVADEIDAANRLVGLWNSWGPGWGLGGRFYLSFDDLDTLLRSEGDCTVPYV